MKLLSFMASPLPFKASALKNLLRKGARLALPLYLALLLISGWVLPVAASPAAQGQGPNRAGLVVVHGDGRVVTRCVSFEEPEISGLSLLQQSGLNFLTESGPMGSTLCALDGEGCPATDCFCECKGTPCAYWNYFHRSADGSWAYSGLGVAVWPVKNGDMDAWVWGDGSQTPPALSFDAVCSGATGEAPAAAPDTPTSAPPATSTPEAVATATLALPPTSTPPTPEATLTETPAPERGVSEVPASDTQTATPSATATPTATSAVTASPEPTSTPVDPTPTETAPEATLRSEPVAEDDGSPQQYPAFILILAIVGAAFFLLRGRRRS